MRHQGHASRVTVQRSVLHLVCHHLLGVCRIERMYNSPLPATAERWSLVDKCALLAGSVLIPRLCRVLRDQFDVFLARGQAPLTPPPQGGLKPPHKGV